MCPRGVANKRQNQNENLAPTVNLTLFSTALCPLSIVRQKIGKKVKHLKVLSAAPVERSRTAPTISSPCVRAAALGGFLKSPHMTGDSKEMLPLRQSPNPLPNSQRCVMAPESKPIAYVTCACKAVGRGTASC